MSGGSPAGSASGGGAPPEGMVSSQANGNGGSNLLTDFGSAYEEAMGTLTKEDNVFDRSPETMQQELETKILRMSEMARKLETFFCQRRFLLHSHKPEYLLREDCQEIRQEILRKDELIRRHGDKLAHWQTVLSDMQGGAAAAAVTASPASDQQPQQQQPPPPTTTTVMRPGAPLQPNVGAPQGGFMPRAHNYSMINPNPRGAGMHPHHHAPPVGAPLAYLEKTATSIGSNQPPYGPNR